jgi:hypothetical protein
MVSVVSAALLAVLVAGHGGLTFPPPRNNHGNTNPANHTPDGSLDTIHGGNGCAGGECFWFSEGCYIGCPNCTLKDPATGNRYNHPNCEHPAEASLPQYARTWNVQNLSKMGDWTRYHPWRAPGRAPVADPCGLAGGYITETPGGGETPTGAKQGDLGSKLPPLKDVHTVWIAGAVAEAGWVSELRIWSINESVWKLCNFGMLRVLLTLCFPAPSSAPCCTPPDGRSESWR